MVQSTNLIYLDSELSRSGTMLSKQVRRVNIDVYGISFILS